MNKSLKNINIEDVLFFDSELVRLVEELKSDSPQFATYQKKTRDMKTDEFLTEEEVIEHFRKRGALVMTYNKIVTVGVGYVRDGEARIKALTGTEEEVLMEFCTISRNFKYVCGYNIIEFDLPHMILNAIKYFDVTEVLPDPFNPSGKKPWEMKQIIDLMGVVKGTAFRNPSFEEVCIHLGIPSPKDAIDGSMVSEVYYKEGIAPIAKYVKKDVFAAIQVFQRVRFDEVFETFTDVDADDVEEEIEALPPLERLYNNNELSKDVEDEIRGLIGKKKLTKKDKSNLFTILRGAYIRTDFVNMDQDSKKIVAAKEEEINEFIESL